VVGSLAPETWRGEGRPADLFDVKGVLEAVTSHLGAPLELEPATEPFLHPTRAAAVEVGGQAVGWLGEIHPRVAAAWDLPAAVGFEVDLAPLVAEADFGGEAYEDVTTFPALYQDLAVVVPEDLSADAVRATVLEAGGDLLRSAAIFDLFHGEQVGEGRKSIALRLEFRAPDRTLTDEEVTPIRVLIEAAIVEIGGSFRE
jgi:phenylalanyl-tRNA synthetase beta chain